MSELLFSVIDAQPKRHAASPTIRFRLRISGASEPIEAMVLRVQIRIEPQWRSYETGEQSMLNDLFGTPDRWNKTLHALSWADVPLMVPAFTGETQVDLHVPCTYDFDLAATRFFNALGGGEVPLQLFFSGSIFRHATQSFAVEMLSWNCECAYRMPLQVWRAAMESCYGDSAMLRIDRETFERLSRVRAANGFTSWEQTLEKLLTEQSLTS